MTSPDIAPARAGQAVHSRIENIRRLTLGRQCSCRHACRFTPHPVGVEFCLYFSKFFRAFGSKAAFVSASSSPNCLNSSSFWSTGANKAPPISPLQFPIMSGTFACLPVWYARSAVSPRTFHRGFSLSKFDYPNYHSPLPPSIISSTLSARSFARHPHRYLQSYVFERSLSQWFQLKRDIMGLHFLCWSACLWERHRAHHLNDQSLYGTVPLQPVWWARNGWTLRLPKTKMVTLFGSPPNAAMFFESIARQQPDPCMHSCFKIFRMFFAQGRMREVPADRVIIYGGEDDALFSKKHCLLSRVQNHCQQQRRFSPWIQNHHR